MKWAKDTAQRAEGSAVNQVGRQGSGDQSTRGRSQPKPTRARGVSHPGETHSNHDLEAAEEVEDEERRQ